MTHQFFESKAHALDDIAEYGASKLFAEVAFGIAMENDLLLIYSVDDKKEILYLERLGSHSVLF